MIQTYKFMTANVVNLQEKKSKVLNYENKDRYL